MVSIQITLDVAVEVLSDIKVDDDITTDDVKQMFHNTMFAKRSYNESDGQNGGDFSRNVRAKVRISNGENPKTQRRCSACKQPSYGYRDPKCIHNVICPFFEGKDVLQHSIDKHFSKMQALLKKASNYRAKVSVSDIFEVIGENKGGRVGNSNGNLNEAKSYFR